MPSYSIPLELRHHSEGIAGLRIVHTPTGNFSIARRALWNRNRIQLGIGLLLATFIPYAVHYPFEAHRDLDSLRYSLVGSAIALIGGYYGFRRVSRYPGALIELYQARSITAPNSFQSGIIST